MKVRVYLSICVCFTHSFAVHLHRVKAGGLYVEDGVCNAVLGSFCKSAPPLPNSENSPKIKQLQQFFKNIMLQKQMYVHMCACYLDVLYKLLCGCINEWFAVDDGLYSAGPSSSLSLQLRVQPIRMLTTKHAHVPVA